MKKVVLKSFHDEEFDGGSCYAVIYHDEYEKNHYYFLPFVFLL